MQAGKRTTRCCGEGILVGVESRAFGSIRVIELHMFKPLPPILEEALAGLAGLTGRKI